MTTSVIPVQLFHLMHLKETQNIKHIFVRLLATIILWRSYEMATANGNDKLAADEIRMGRKPATQQHKVHQLCNVCY